jgi:hypothetical protein
VRKGDGGKREIELYREVSKVLRSREPEYRTVACDASADPRITSNLRAW